MKPPSRTNIKDPFVALILDGMYKKLFNMLLSDAFPIYIYIGREQSIKPCIATIKQLQALMVHIHGAGCLAVIPRPYKHLPI